MFSTSKFQFSKFTVTVFPFLRIDRFYAILRDDRETSHSRKKRGKLLILTFTRGSMLNRLILLNYNLPGICLQRMFNASE